MPENWLLTTERRNSGQRQKLYGRVPLLSEASKNLPDGRFFEFAQLPDDDSKVVISEIDAASVRKVAEQFKSLGGRKYDNGVSSDEVW